MIMENAAILIPAVNTNSKLVDLVKEQMSEKNMAYHTVVIETISGEDRVPHFRAVSDSCVIYKPLIKNIASSLLSAMVDITSFMVLVLGGNSIFSATVIARLVSGIFNFSLNKIWVFRMKDSHKTGNEFLKYLALFLLQMMFSGYLTEELNSALNFHNSLLLSKILVDLKTQLIDFITFF